MKRSFLFYFAVLGFLGTACHHAGDPAEHNPRSSVLVRQLQHLLDQKEYFRLEKKLNFYQDSIGRGQHLFFQAFLDNAFNRNQQAIQNADSLLKDRSSTWPDSSKANIYLLMEDSYFKLFRYAKAAEMDSIVLNHYAAALDSDKVDDIKNQLLIRNALRAEPAQQTTIPGDEELHWKKDRIGLIEIPVKSHAVLYDGIFDTRANISSITQTYATRLGLKMLDVHYEEGSGITGIKFQTGLGVADSLYIGNILVRNAVFQVMPDSILYIAPLKFSLNLIIGFPIIEQLGEVQLYRDGRMKIPSVPTEAGLHNFALDGLDPVISLKTDQDTLCFHLDMGADQTILYQAYFEKFKQDILTSGRKKSEQFGGAGGVQKKDVYVLPALRLSLGDKNIKMDSIDVLTQKIFPDEKFYGNLGRDFAFSFAELIFNFKYMYIKGI
jgi:hypothetical protein